MFPTNGTSLVNMPGTAEMYIDDPKATIANEKATSPAANGDMDASHTLLATDLGPKILIDIERPPP